MCAGKLSVEPASAGLTCARFSPARVCRGHVSVPTGFVGEFTFTTKPMVGTSFTTIDGPQWAELEAGAVDTFMAYHELLFSERWRQFREQIHKRDGGRCVLCCRPGVDVHHLTYRWCQFDPHAVILVCRECHLAWRGRTPDHLDATNPFQPSIVGIAELARCLDGCNLGC